MGTLLSLSINCCGILELKTFEEVFSVNGIVEDAENIINGEVIHEGGKKVVILQSKSGVCSVLQTDTLQRPMSIEKMKILDLKLIGFLKIILKPVFYFEKNGDYMKMSIQAESNLLVYPDYSNNVFIFSDIEGKTVKEIPFSKQVLEVKSYFLMVSQRKGMIGE